MKITDIQNGLVATVTAQHDTEIVVTFADLDGLLSTLAVLRRQ